MSMSSEFSYRPLLEGVTEAAAQPPGLDPYEAYAWLYERAKKAGLRGETYASTSITSGGHARDDSLEMREIIARNTESARLLAEQLAADRQIDANTTIEPVFVGKTGWSQAEYMEFWLAVIAGAQLTTGFTARDVDALRKAHRMAYEAGGIDLDTMNSHADASERAAQYFNMAAISADTYKEGVAHNPVGRLVRMIDTDQSLGSQAERIFARSLAVPVMNICVVKPVNPSELVQVNSRLAADTDRLIQFGATVFDLEVRTRLMLVEDVRLAA